MSDVVTVKHIRRWLKGSHGFFGASFARGTIVTPAAQRLMAEHDIPWKVVWLTREELAELYPSKTIHD